MLTTKNTQFFYGITVLSLIFILLPFASLKGQSQKDLIKKQAEDIKELEKQYLWCANYSAATEFRVQDDLKQELSNNKNFMDIIKSFADDLKIGYQGRNSIKSKRLFSMDNLTEEEAGASVPQHGVACYPSCLVWTHKKGDTVTEDTLPQRLFGNYASNIIQRFNKKGAMAGDVNYMSHFLSLPDDSPYHVEMTLVGFKKDISSEKSQEFLARYPAYLLKDAPDISSNSYVMTSRQWWKDIFDTTRTNCFQWRASTTKGTHFKMGLSRPFVSATGQNTQAQRSLWIDIDLDDNSNAKMVLTILLTRKAPSFVNAIRDTCNNEPPPKKRLALLIGNAAYSGGIGLLNPENDVDAMSKTLEKLGFEVMPFKNLTRDSMRKVIERFKHKLNGESSAFNVGLFYYSGHGYEDNLNYIVPVDYVVGSGQGQTNDFCTNTQSIREGMAKANSDKTFIMILDACRDNPFIDGIRGRRSNRWQASADDPTNFFTIYSTSLGYTSSDKGKNNSNNGLFTKFLLKHLPTSCIKIEEMILMLNQDFGLYNEKLPRDEKMQIPEMRLKSTNIIFRFNEEGCPK